MSYLSSTIGRKQVVGIAGLGLCLFVLTHMLGNLLVFVSPQAYNEYGHALTSNPLIYIAEAGLIAIFLGHIILALCLSMKNKAARPVKYAVNAEGEKSTSFVTKTMKHQGIVILVFVVWHLYTFKFGSFAPEQFEVQYGDVVMRDLYRLMVEVFANPMYVAWYVFAVFILGYHLSHGFSSAIKTLGFSHPKYDDKLTKLGWLYSALVTLGFASQPIYVFLSNQ